MQAIQRGRYFHIGSKKVIRSFGSVYTVAKAFLHLAEHGRPGEAYNIADRRPMLLEEFTNELSHEIGAQEPKRLPYTIAWSAAVVFSLARSFGVSGPITLDSLRKLTESFSVSTEKLAATGFQWQDEDSQKARSEMVKVFLAGIH
jgi:nucleoside-diphosphate-sugar epimerase